MPVLLFLVSVAYVPLLPSAPVVGRWAVAGIGAAWLLRSVRVHSTPGHWLSAAFLAWCLLTLSWTFEPYDAWWNLLHLGIIGMVFCLAAEVGSLDGCYRALALGAWANLPFALAQALGWQPVQTVSNAGDPVGLFLSTTMFSEFSTITLIGAIGLKKKWPIALGPLGCVLLSIWSRGLFVMHYNVGGRETIFVLLAAGAAWLFFTTPRSRLPLVLAAAVPFLMIHFDLFQYLGSNRLSNIDDRLEVWEMTYRSLTWGGWGLGSYALLFRAYETAHSELFEFAFEIGAGVVFLIGVVAYALAVPGRVRERVLLAAWCAQALVYSPLHAPMSAVVGAMLSGWIAGDRRRELVAQSVRRDMRMAGLMELRAVRAGSL